MVDDALHQIEDAPTERESAHECPRGPRHLTLTKCAPKQEQTDGGEEST